MEYFIQYTYHIQLGEIAMDDKILRGHHIVIRCILLLLSIGILFFPVYQDLSGYSITFFKFQPFFSISTSVFITIHFLFVTFGKQKLKQDESYHVGLYDFMWLLMIIMTIIITLTQQTSYAVYKNFEVSYFINIGRFPPISSIRDYVNLSYQVYLAIALAIVLSLYMGYVHVIMRKKNQK